MKICGSDSTDVAIVLTPDANSVAVVVVVVVKNDSAGSGLRNEGRTIMDDGVVGRCARRILTRPKYDMEVWRVGFGGGSLLPRGACNCNSMVT